ncbi:MAG TPA: transferrin receptor-like dimerization domain-containing protein, partial [Terriglobales bacterium]|nr:transferrin receptor-like dimerization domain-containing protein [Terriglobales bacterium]
PPSQVTNLQKIPVLPISYGDALPLLKALDGPVAPAEWRGALPITYHIGAGAATVHLAVKFDWNNIANLYDVIATIPGSEFPDQWVIRGNHLDAWVNGADDPLSGQSALIEEARSLGELLKQGWRPKRTIIYAAWDGEEPSLIGSTEWAETHAAELSKKAVAYFNSDTNSKGYLNLGGSQTLQHFLNTVAQDITDPETGTSVWVKDQQHRLQAATTPQQKATVMDGPDLRISALGSGSDYSPFLQHLGIASVNMGYGGEGGSGGVYHSIYDDFYWYTHFADTTFVYGRALAQTMGTAVIRLADADVLPLQFTGFADNLEQYQREVETEAKKTPGGGSFDFKPLERAIASLKAAATDYDQSMAQASANGSLYQTPAADRAALNDLLYQSERALLDPSGLPMRPWYEHQIYAPGYYTGYGVKTLPGVREAIEANDFKLAASEEAVLVKALDGFTSRIQAARAKL